MLITLCENVERIFILLIADTKPESVRGIFHIHIFYIKFMSCNDYSRPVIFPKDSS